MLPLSLTSLAICAAAAAIVFLLVRRGASLVPLTLFALIGAAWLGASTHAALGLWTGHLVSLVWLAVAAALLPVPSIVSRLGPLRERAAGILAFALLLITWWQVSPQVPGGDEPHYLVITQSLIADGDLKIENNHRQRDYRSYFDGDLRPDFRVRGQDRQIYSIHAPGVSALVAPAFALGGYKATVVFLAALSALGAALAWHLAWTVTNRADAAWFGWAAVTLSATWIFHAFTIYPDGLGAVVLLTGAWALVRLEREGEQSTRVLPWFFHGAALAVLPWLHSRFAVLAGTVGTLVLLRLVRQANGTRKALAFLVVPVMSAVAWLGYFVRLYGTPNPAAPYGGEQGGLQYVPDGLAGLLFDQRFGLFAYAPVLMLAVAGTAAMLSNHRWRRYALELVCVAVPYLVVVTCVAMWWGGHSAPARFAAPLVPWLAVPVAAAWASMSSRATRAVAIAALLFTAFITSVLVFAADGALAFNNTRDMPALWLDWLNTGIDLPRALPAWARADHVPLYRGIAIWLCAAIAAWLSLRRIEMVRPRLSRPALVTLTAWAFAAAASLAVNVSWLFERSSGYQPAVAQLDALRVLAREPHVLAVSAFPLRRLDRGAAAASLRIEPARGPDGGDERPTYTLPALPAGEYRLRPVVVDTGGRLALGIGAGALAIETRQLAEVQAGLTLRLPVGVRALMLRADEAARRNVRGLEVRVSELPSPAERVSDKYARHAVRYAQTTAYFLDEKSYPEADAFWVKGNAESEIVIQPHEECDVEKLLLRNGANQNSVRVIAAKWTRDLRLAPGEEVEISIPLNVAAGATLVRFSTSAGFVPSVVDPQSRDDRYLGVWVKVGG